MWITTITILGGHESIKDYDGGINEKYCNVSKELLIFVYTQMFYQLN